MNSRQRQILIERDRFLCVSCKGACPHRGRGEEPCKLPSAKLAPAVYFRVEAGYHPLGRMQVHHAFGKKREGYNEAASLCPCCHRHCTQGGGDVQEAVVAYLATVGPEPEEYRIAREQEAAEKPIRKAKRKAKAKASRKARKAWVAKKRGDEPVPLRGLRLPSKTLAQMSRPNFNSFR